MPLIQWRSVRHVAVVVATSVGCMVIGLCTSIVIARTLGPTGRGLMAQALLWPPMLSYACGFSLASANTFFGSQQPAFRRKLFANSALMSIVVGVPTGIVSSVVLPHLISVDSSIHGLFAVGLLLMPLGLWSDYACGLLQGVSKFGQLGLIRIVCPLGIFSCVSVLWWADRLTVRSTIIANWIGASIPTFMLLWFLYRADFYGWRPDWKLLHQSMRYCLHIFGGTIAGVLNKRVDQLVMTAVVAPRLLGLYAFAVSLAEMLTIITSAVSAVLLPKVAGEADANTRRAISIRAVRVSFIAGGIAAVALGLFARIFISALWGNKFMDALPSVWILVFGSVALGGVSSMRSALQGIGRPLAGSIGEYVSLLFMLPLLYLLLPRAGIVGAAIASTISYWVNCIAVGVVFVPQFGFPNVFSLREAKRDCVDVWAFGIYCIDAMRRTAFAAPERTMV